MYTKVFALFALFALAAASCPGCPFQGDADDAEVLVHLKQVLKTQNSDDQVVKVLSVQKQVVSGFKYSVKFQTQDASGVQKVCQSQYVLQPWVSKQPQVLSYSCSKLSEVNVDTFAYERQMCAGCPTKHDPKEYDVSEYLKKVLATQNSDDKVTKVVSVTTQVVSGVKYTVEFESQDPKTNAKKVCKTEFISQPWVSHVPQVLSFKCQQQAGAQFTVLRQLEESDPYDVTLQLGRLVANHRPAQKLSKVLSFSTREYNGVEYTAEFEVVVVRTGVKEVCKSVFYANKYLPRPQVASYSCHKKVAKRSVCAGCEQKQDPTKYDVSSELKEVLSTMNSDDEVTKVISVTTQVVSGVKYSVEFESQDPKTNAKKVCSTVFLSQPWVSKKPQVLSFKCNKQVGAQFTVLSQLEESDPYDVTLQVGRLVKSHQPPHQLSKILSVSTREYNGVEYTAEFEVVVARTGVKEVCKSVFYANKYLHRPQVASYSCHKKVAKRSVCAGCEQKQDPTKYDVSSELKEVLSTMNSDDEVTKVISVTTQVVSGVKYTVEFESQDPKTNAKKVCSTVFLSQPWVSKKPQVMSFKCNKQVQKRSVLVGAPVEQDPSEVDLTQELKQVMASQNSEDKITKVVSIKSQVVAGMKYTVEFETENPKTHAVHMCKTTFVSAPWVSKVPQVESYKCY